jgi:hypothetical protein
VVKRPPPAVDWIRGNGSDTLLRVHAQTRAARAGVGAVDPWRAALLVRVRAPPQGGRANGEIVEVLSQALGVPPSTVEIVRGLTSREKEVRVRGCSLERARAVLEGGK